MFTIDLILKYTPLPVSVQRQDETSAKETYQHICDAMRAASPSLIELACDKQTEKRIAVFSDQIAAAVVSQKTGGTAAGRVPGFFAAAVGNDGE